MSASRPIVLVYEDFASVSTNVTAPDLNVLVVGPAYRVLDYATSRNLIATAAVGASNTVAFTPPSLSAVPVPGYIAGDVVDDGSLGVAPVLVLENAEVEILSGSDGVIAVDQNYLTSAGHDFVAAGVQVGDRAVLSDIDSNAGVVTVARIVTSVAVHQLTFSQNFFVGSLTDINGNTVSIAGLTTAGIQYRISRVLSSVAANQAVTVVNPSSAPTFSVGALTVPVAGVNKNVITATPCLQYRALRTDLAQNPVTVTSVADVTNFIGALDERNPGAVGAYVALANSSKSVKFAGVPSDDAPGHLAVQANMHGRSDIYAVVPLTQDRTIISNWERDCTVLSQPGVARFRVVIGSVKRTALLTLIAPAAGARGAIETTHNTLLDNTAQFLTVGVKAGDTVTINGVSYPVVSVQSENRLTFSYAVQPTSAGNLAYSIVRTMSKDDQAADLAAVATSIGSKRCVLVWPDECKVSGIKNAYTGASSWLGGQYAAAAVGGMVAGLPPHQGFTYISLAGVSEIRGSNTYFNDSQLESISNAGWFVIAQDSIEAAPFCYHELTTDVSTLESGELMVVKNYDYVALTIKSALNAFLGVYNVTNQSLAFVRAAVLSAADTLKATNYPRIGAPLIDLSVDTLKIDPASADQVDLYCSIKIPRPLNRIGLHLTA